MSFRVISALTGLSVPFGARFSSTIIKPAVLRSYRAAEEARFLTLEQRQKKFGHNKETVTDLKTFFDKIGRKSSEYAESFESLDEFLKTDSHTLKEKGIDTRMRRYMLNWRQKFLDGENLIQFKQPKKKLGGERRRKQFIAKLRAEQRASKK